VSDETQAQVEQLRRLFEDELDHRLGPQRGCWPLLVAIAGLLLGLALLVGLV
jgi:hypothetical protein